MKPKIFYTVHAKGGSGASLFATNFAYALSKKHPRKRILFLDANQFSDIANLFGIKAKKNILNLNMFFKEKHFNAQNRKNLRDIFAKNAYQINNLDVLLSPEEFNPQVQLNSIYKEIISAGLNIYDYIIIDSERDNNKLFQFSLPNTERIFIVTTADKPAITKTTNFLKTFSDEATILQKINLIYNQAGKFSEKELQNIFEFPMAAILPTENNGAWDNVLLGVPIIENKKLAYSKKINRLIDNLFNPV